ncbi:tail fiber repeat 2 protein [Paenibacillus lactis 154]|uniref:Tail fiber repeat 2 protein n=1 Tax=Paenibacillus lactis 154 TaxID=743719 RepID=G4HEK7_9BACL|nr:tail fiber protein [Paenibacillus lactis]EHB65276.1 tail fiber repeat 2 protein [Paenibacillus lactis 154]
MPSQTPNLDLYKVNGETDGNDTFNVDVVLNDNWDKIDAAVGQIQEDLGNVTVPDASLTQKGIVQLSSALNSISESLAATPKAVKSAYDEALAAKQLGVEQKANVVAALNSIGVSASTSESWAQLIQKIAAVIRATGNATAADILAGKTASNASGQVTGTIPILNGIRTATGAGKWPDGALAVYPEKGYQKGGAGDGEIKVTTAQLQAAEANLNSNYILNGHPIFGVPGGIANRSAENHHMPGQDMTVWAGDRVFIAPPRGYYDGSSWVTAPATGIKPENLRDGVSFGPVIGSLKTIGPGDKMRFFQDIGPTGLYGTTPQIAVGCTISVAGTYRVVFYLGVDDGLIGYGQIYVNGSPRGTLRSVTSSYIGYVEDISINGNDKIQVYAWTNQSGGGYVRLRDFTVSTDIEVWSSRT